MDHDTLFELGQYLNKATTHDTCDKSLSHSETWLRAHNRPDVEGDLAWLQSQGAVCDCEVILKIYLPALQKRKTNSITMIGQD